MHIIVVSDRLAKARSIEFSIRHLVLGGVGVAAGLVVLAAFSAPAFAGCDQAQAVDTIIDQTELKRLQAGEAQTAEDSQKIVAANEKVNLGGEALGKGDYDKACAIYDEVAKENGISL